METKFKFSNWMKWEDRVKFSDGRWPGVYMIAITNKNIEDTEYDFRHVVYIGMTNSKDGLFSRWNQLHAAINKGYRKSHSGGNTIYDDLGNYKDWKKKLFVCAWPIKCNVVKSTRTPNDLIKMGKNVFREYEVLAAYKKKMKKEPKYNKR